ncbi:MAG: hypothetical protein M3R08_12240 [Bacteroidota bacterium]|nr:hypothetical protein [Bacteroidota bacterium]
MDLNVRIIILVIFLLPACTPVPDPLINDDSFLPEASEPSLLEVIEDHDLLTFDIVQRTCALYVALKSSSLRGAPAFDRDLDATMVRWKCDDGNVMACASVPPTHSDSFTVGRPWELAL